MLGNENGSSQEISSDVYVIYGRNSLALNEMYKFLNKLSLRYITKAMAVNWAGDGSPFAGRIIDAAFEHAKAVIVLLTEEDEVRLREKFWQVNEEDYEKVFLPQPRQDQIFEAGYAFGSFPERTILLRVGRVRPFSDIDGRYIENFSEEETDRSHLINRLKNIVDKVPETNKNSSDGITAVDDPKKVFVVYGRNHAMKDALFAFLNVIGLFPISWQEAVWSTNKGAPYIGEILDALLSQAQAVIVLLTGDDEVLLSSENGSGDQNQQPRPNVLFEAGMAFSNKRLADRTILVEIGKLRLCEALVGRHRIKLTNSIEQRWELALSLQRAGCQVEMPGNELLREIGDFNCD